jgi:hypothetical protein
MKKAIEIKHVDEIERDLAAARRESRFKDALEHLDEIFVIHLHTENEPLRARCAALLAAPETLHKAA